MIRIPFALGGAAMTAAWVLSTARFIHEPEHVKWVIAGLVMLPFILLAETLARKGKSARKPAQQRPSGGYPYIRPRA